jgi:large conductance mechanosensitive channel
MNKILKEFRDFAMRGRVLDLAIGVIIGGAFNTVVRSFTGDILTPPLQLLRSGDFANLFVVLREGSEPPPYVSLAAATEAGAVTLNIGTFIDSITAFLITAIALFLVVRAINAAKRKEEQAPAAAPTTKKCPYCLSEIPIAAVRCAYCTSDLPPAPEGEAEPQPA